MPTVVDNGLPHSSPTPFPIGLATAGPDEFTVDNQFPGVAIHLVTSGGIFPWDVRLLVARDLTVGPLWDRMPGGAWRIRLPTDAAPLRPGSTLTLPYATGRLDGFPEQDLRIYCYDPGARAWQLTADDQTVDVDADTVTTPVSRLSDCAVFSIPPDA